MQDASHSVEILNRTPAEDSEVAADTAIMTCSDWSQWNSPSSAGFKGLRYKRPMDPQRCQAIADQLAQSDLLGPENVAVETLDIQSIRGSPGDVRNCLREAAERIVSPLSLPNDLSECIAEDAAAIGEQLAQLLPDVHTVQVKVEAFGADVCSRWHRDTYIGRAICSYSCSGTVYMEDRHVDMWELENCGNNDCVVRDKSTIRSIDVGDVLLMKGKAYPSDVKGLIHKSPEVRHHFDGRVMHRLVLKVDVPVQPEPLQMIEALEYAQ